MGGFAVSALRRWAAGALAAALAAGAAFPVGDRGRILTFEDDWQIAEFRIRPLEDVKRRGRKFVGDGTLRFTDGSEAYVKVKQKYSPRKDLSTYVMKSLKGLNPAVRAKIRVYETQNEVRSAKVKVKRRGESAYTSRASAIVTSTLEPLCDAPSARTDDSLEDNDCFEAAAAVTAGPTVYSNLYVNDDDPDYDRLPALAGYTSNIVLDWTEPTNGLLLEVFAETDTAVPVASATGADYDGAHRITLSFTPTGSQQYLFRVTNPSPVPSVKYRMTLFISLE